jgi:hypothetical protein
MSLPRWLQALRPLLLEFWLPLPLLGIIFWLGGNFVTSQVLSRPYSTVSKLQADTQQEVQLSVTVLVIKAEIERSEGVTQVEVKTADPSTQKAGIRVSGYTSQPTGNSDRSKTRTVS